MPQDKRRDVRSYTTMLGTRAYILGKTQWNRSRESAPDEEISAEVQHHPLPSLRSQRTPPTRSRPWREVVRPPYSSRCSGSEGRAVRQSGKGLITSFNNGSDFGTTDELRHLLPTKVVVSPGMHTASPEAPRPTSHWRIPVSQLPSSSNSAGVTTLKTAETMPPDVPSTTKYPVNDMSTQQVVDLSLDLPKVLSPTPPSNVHRTGVGNNSFHCSIEDHQSMLESGFVYCSHCGMRVNYAPLVEYSSQECPVAHEKLIYDVMESSEGAGRRYCILCGSLINNRILPLQEKQEKGTGDAESLMNVNLPPRSAENVPVCSPSIMSGENLVTTTPCKPLPGFGTGGDEVRVNKDSGNRESHFSVKTATSFPPQSVVELHTGDVCPVPTPFGNAAGTRKEKVVGTETFTSEMSPRPSPILTVPPPVPLVPTAAAAVVAPMTAENEARRMSETVGSPFTSLKGTRLENDPGGRVQTSISRKSVDARAVKRDFLYTAGVPGVSCGLPNCALCMDLVGLSSPPVAPSWHHSPINEVKSHDEAKVVVVHNHYYHKM